MAVPTRKRLNRLEYVSRWLPLTAILISASMSYAQEFQITEIGLTPQGGVVVRHPSDTNSYYILYRGDAVTEIVFPVDMALGEPAVLANSAGRLADHAPLAETAFYRVLKIPLSQPRDSDGDGIDDVYELRHWFLDPLNRLDALLDFDHDGRSNLYEYQHGTNPEAAEQSLTVIASSPANGEQGVSVTRETVLHFSNPLTNTVVISTNQLYAQFGGRRILSRIDLSTDRRKATLFYLEPLPGSARVRVTFVADQVRDTFGNAVDADGDGIPGGTATIDFDTLSLTPFASTIVCGRVFASELAVRTNGMTNISINVPLAGVIVTADGLEQNVRAVTDQFGDFRLTNAPAGPFFVHVDGRAVTNLAAGIRYPDLAYYPFVGKEWVSVLGGETNIGEVYLPLVSTGTLRPTSLTNQTVVTFPDAVLQMHPELQGVSIFVPPNSLFSDSGQRGGMVGIAPVPPDRLPGPLPEGLDFPLVITVQTDGPSNFDQPVSACFPNLPDPITGVRLPPGAKSALWSFNYDTGRFEMVGPMTVTADGLLVCTDPGVGIPAPGWHGTDPGTPGNPGGPGGPSDEPPPGDECNPQIETCDTCQ